MQNKIIAFITTGLFTTVIMLILLVATICVSNKVNSSCNWLLLINTIISFAVLYKEEYRAVGLGILFGGGLPLLYILNVIS